MATWPLPDPAAAAGPSLVAKSQVQLLELKADGWAHVRCDNGWEAWVDGRLLTPFVPKVVTPKLSPNPLVMIGVGALLLGSFMPWVTVPGGSMSAWQMPSEFLLGRADDLGGPKVGLLLLVVAAVALAPFVSNLRLPWFATASIAALAVEAVGMTLLRVRALTLDATVGIGAVIVVVGAAFIAVDAGMTATQKK